MSYGKEKFNQERVLKPASGMLMLFVTTLLLLGSVGGTIAGMLVWADSNAPGIVAFLIITAGVVIFV